MPIVMRLSVTQQAVPTAMKETNNFEQKLDRLIELCQQLKQENQALREREAGLMGERSELIEKNGMARQKIETMINRLRNLSAEQ